MFAVLLALTGLTACGGRPSSEPAKPATVRETPPRSGDRSGLDAYLAAPRWTELHLADGSNLYGISGSSWQDVVVVGDRGTIIEFDGDVWHEVRNVSSARFLAVDVAQNGVAWAVGSSGAAVRRRDGQWVDMPSQTEETLHMVRSLSTGDAVVAGSNGTVGLYRGGAWTVERCLDLDWYGLRLEPDGRAVTFTTFSNGLVCRHDDDRGWEVVRLAQRHTPVGVMSAEWVGPDGRECYVNPDGLFCGGTLVFSPDTTLLAVWGIDSDHMIAAGEGGTLFTFAGQ